MMSAKTMAPSSGKRRSGWSVISAARLGVRIASSKVWRTAGAGTREIASRLSHHPDWRPAEGLRGRAGVSPYHPARSRISALASASMAKYPKGPSDGRHQEPRLVWRGWKQHTTTARGMEEASEKTLVRERRGRPSPGRTRCRGTYPSCLRRDSPTRVTVALEIARESWRQGLARSFEAAGKDPVRCQMTEGGSHRQRSRSDCPASVPA